MRVRALVLQQLRETLPPEEMTEIDRHLAGCRACREEQPALAVLSRKLSACAPPPPISTGSTAPARAWACIRKSAARDSTPVSALRKAAFFAAALTVVTLGGYALCLYRGDTPTLSLTRRDRELATSNPGSLHTPPGLPPAQTHASRRYPVRAGGTHQGSQPRRPTLRTGIPSERAGHTGTRTHQSTQIHPLPDSEYLNGRDPGRLAHWMVGDSQDPAVLGWLTRVLPPVKDDFVHIPLPRVASTDRKDPTVAAALRTYEQEAKTVDARLFQKVSVSLKAVSLERLCAELEEKTQVRIRSSRGVRDDKVTVLLKDRPAREVMRGVARLFGYTWERTREPGGYRYELLQDLRSQLAEQEMRDRDLNAAFVALDDAMNAQARKAAQDFARLRVSQEAAAGPERAALGRLLQFWAHLRIYQLLTPADRTALLRGESIRFVLNSQNADRRLPQEIYEAVYDQMEFGKIFQDGVGGPGARPFIGLSLDRSEMGQIALQATHGGDSGVGPDGRSTWGGMTYGPISVGQSPSVSSPDNTRHNAALRKHPLLQRSITLQPRPSCPHFAPRAAPRSIEGEAEDFHVDGQGYLQSGPEPPHVHSADVWEAVHLATGLSVIADAFSRNYPASELQVKDVPAFDALCRTADRLGVRWMLDGNMLLSRSTSYFWGRIKEVPNRFLERWQNDARQAGGLPFEDLLEMSLLSDAQLDSAHSGRYLEHCCNLDEWGIIGAGSFRYGIHFSELRPYARILAAMGPAQRRLAFHPGGMALEEMPAVHQEVLVRLLKRGYSTQDLHGLRLGVEYAASGVYVWELSVPRSHYDEAQKWPLVTGRTREAALGAARKHYPAAQPDQVRRSRGEFVVTLWNSEGILIRFGNEISLREEK